MDTMNQGAGMGSAPVGQTPMGPAMNTPKKKSSAGIIIVLIVVAVVIALLVFSQGKMDTDTMTQEETTATYDGQTEPVDSNSDELGDLEADVNSLNFDDIDAGLK